jgi:cutinase
LGAATVTVPFLMPLASAPSAAAESCPDVQVVFARGTFEAPGVGAVGQSFVDALQGQLPNKSVDVYAVDYPASLDFARAADGVADASNKVQDVVAKCPKTKVVLGGYSQGAAVIAYITTDKVPPNFELPAGITGPMPKSVASHVSTVALFGKPSTGFLNMLDRNAPPITIGSEYGKKAIDLCADRDPVCSPDGAGDPGVHGSYADNGMTAQAAAYAAQHVSSSST